jgi:hypothetical protein
MLFIVVLEALVIRDPEAALNGGRSLRKGNAGMGILFRLRHL